MKEPPFSRLPSADAVIRQSMAENERKVAGFVQRHIKGVEFKAQEVNTVKVPKHVAEMEGFQAIPSYLRVLAISEEQFSPPERPAVEE